MPPELMQTIYFNSQPHKEADCVPDPFFFFVPYFNSQPHKEADNGPVGTRPVRAGISIHSLTRRLTIDCGQSDDNPNISIHSLTRRLTTGISLPESHVSYFNSQPHKEADDSIYRELCW